MDTSSQIREHIEYIKKNISSNLDEMSDIIHQKVDIQSKIREKPYESLAVAIGAGFLVATISKPAGKFLMKFVISAVTGAAGAYVTRKGIDFVSNKICACPPDSEDDD